MPAIICRPLGLAALTGDVPASALDTFGIAADLDGSDSSDDELQSCSSAAVYPWDQWEHMIAELDVETSLVSRSDQSMSSRSMPREVNPRDGSHRDMIGM
ncbi:MAG: hypothetical protein ACKPKO_02635, partial [Candidatus Fonsibacter sp.]